MFYEDYENIIRDYETLIKVVSHKYKDSISIFLMGVSFGAPAVIMTAEKMKSTIAGVILCAPLLSTDTTFVNSYLSPFKNLLVRYLPRYRPSRSININDISRDTDVLSKFASDPLIVYTPLSVIQRYSLDKTINETFKIAPKIDWSYVILHGTEDRIANFTASQAFYAKTPTSEKSFLVLDGFYHDVLHDYDYQQAYKFILSYTNKRGLINKAVSVEKDDSDKKSSEKNTAHIKKELHQASRTII